MSLHLAAGDGAMFERDRHYTRAEIHDQLGGGLQEYLPHVDGEVVCVCVTLEMNPHAPTVLLVGDGDNVQRYGVVLAGQREALPVFLKRGTNEWDYLGEYTVRGSSSAPADIARWASPAGRGNITMVVFMQPVGSPLVAPGTVAE
jgi:hypothetical protein